MPEYSIIIADDSSIFAESLKIAFTNLDTIKDIHCATNFEEIKQCLKHPVNVIILDLHFQTSTYDGIQIARILRDEYPELKIIVLSQNVKVDFYEVLMHDIGVDAYLDKSIRLSTLFEYFEQVVRGERCTDESIQKMLSIGKWMKISKREHEVLEQTKQGLSQKEIADKLCVSQKTIEGHLLNLRERFDVKNTLELLVIYTAYKNSPREDVNATRPPFYK